MFVLFYYKNTTEVEIDDSFTLDTFTDSLMSRALDDTEETGKIDIALSEVQINSILNNVLTQVTANMDYVNDFLDNFYVDITDRQYNFYITGHASFFYSQVVLYTTLEEDMSHESNDENFIAFKIDDVKIGRTGGLLSIANWALDEFVDFDLESYITNVIDSIGLSMTFDLANWQITYSISDLFNDLKGVIGGSLSLDDGSSSGLDIMSLITECFENNLIGLDFYDNESFSFYIDLENLGDISDGEDDSIYRNLLNLDIDSEIKVKVETLYDEGVITQDDVTAVFDYYFHGYNYIDSSEQAVISRIGNNGFACVEDEGFSYSNYDGLLNRNTDTDSLSSYVKAQIIGDDNASSEEKQEIMQNAAKNVIEGNYDPDDSEKNVYFASVPESILNDYIHTLDSILGYSMLFDRVENDKLICNYIVLDEFFINANENDEIEIGIGLNVNGYKIYARFETLLEFDVDNYSLLYIFEDVYLGNILMSDSLVDSFLSIIQEGVQTDSSTSEMLGIHIAEDANDESYLSFDFSDALQTVEIDFSYNLGSINFDIPTTELGDYDLDYDLGDYGINLGGLSDNQYKIVNQNGSLILEVNSVSIVDIMNIFNKELDFHIDTKERSLCLYAIDKDSDDNDDEIDDSNDSNNDDNNNDGEE